MKTKDWLTIPNLLTVLRLLILPVYVIVYLLAQSRLEYFFAALLLGISSLTDLFDGMIARKYHQVSQLGKALDPIADKATQGVVMICLALHYPAIWLLCLLFALKEGFMLIMGLRNLHKGMIPSAALKAGKVCTGVLFVSMIVMVLIPDLPNGAVWAIVALCALFMLISLGGYGYAFFRRNDYLEELKGLDRSEES